MTDEEKIERLTRTIARLERRVAESRAFILCLADRIFAAHEVLGKRAEKPTYRYEG